MMKQIKLAIIFAALVGLIIWAINNGGEKNSIRPVDDKINIDSICNEIRSQWDAQQQWNIDLYNNQLRDIEQYDKIGELSTQGYNTLRSTLKESAINRACDSYLIALHNKDFKDAVLRNAYKGVEQISELENQDDERIKEVKARQQLYINITKFVGEKHSIKPNFNGSTWDSYTTRRGQLTSTLISQAHSLLGNKYFKEMEHIKGFKDGLSDSAVKSRILTSETDYNSSLATQIISHFDLLDRTQENKQKLGQISEEYWKQTRYEPGSDRIEAFLKDYTPNNEN